MNWRKIDRNSRVQNEGVYSDWKQQISDDCFNQCVYCSIGEQPWGGIDHYHIEHFKPKSKFAELENIITNLYHACPICNRFKSDDWPNETGDLDKICYPDPSDFDYNDLFVQSASDFKLSGKNIASNYIINRLYLNRPQLIFERREAKLSAKADNLMNETSELIKNGIAPELLTEFALLSIEMHSHLSKRREIVPYRLSDIRK